MSYLSTLSDSELCDKVTTLISAKDATTFLRQTGDSYIPNSSVSSLAQTLSLCKEELGTRVRNAETLLAATTFLQVYYEVCALYRSMAGGDKETSAEQQQMIVDVSNSIDRGNAALTNLRLSDEPTEPVEL